jgi:hypothetical protein
MGFSRLPAVTSLSLALFSDVAHTSMIVPDFGRGFGTLKSPDSSKTKLQDAAVSLRGKK